MNTGKEVKDALIECANTMGRFADADPADNAIIVMAKINGEILVATTGSAEQLIKMVAHSTNANPVLEKIMAKAAAIAPVLGMFERAERTDLNGDPEPSNCPTCRERREAAAANLTLISHEEI